MKTIFLVEDDPFLIDIYSTKFKKEGFQVEVIQNGEKALERIKEKIPDVLILDLVLPSLNGWEILHEIQRMKLENKNLEKMKIVILSNLGQKEDVEKGLQLGASKYLIKVFYTPDEVVKEITQIIEND